MRILVTGGVGFIGSHLTDALIRAGHQVRVLDALVAQVHGTASQPKPRFLNPAAEFIRADVCSPEVLEFALGGVEAVFHYAAEVGVGQSMYQIARYVQANTYATALLMQALAERSHHIRKLVVASSMSVYGEGAYRCPNCVQSRGPVAPQLRTREQLLEHDWEVKCPHCRGVLESLPTPEDKPLFPGSVYAISKQDQEQLALVVGGAYGIPTVALRLWNAYGARQALSNPYTGVCAIFSARLLNRQPPMIFEDGSQVRDFVHISDVVQANLLALESDAANGHAINIGSGEAVSIREVARLLARGLGCDIEPVITQKYREGDIRHSVPDLTRARKLLGYKPKVKLRDGIPELLEWVRSQSATDQTELATAELAARRLVK